MKTATSSRVIVFDNCQVLFGEVTEYACHKYSVNPLYALSCRNCRSPTRLCPSCKRDNYEKQFEEMVNPKNGLCKFHEKNGTDAKRLNSHATPVKISQDSATSEYISTRVTRPSLNQDTYYRNKIQDEVANLSDSELEQIRVMVRTLKQGDVDHKILCMIYINDFSNTRIAQNLGWTYQRFTDYFAELCVRMKIPNRKFKAHVHTGIFRREALRRACIPD